MEFQNSDSLQFCNEKSITKLLNPNESILFSCKLIKYNRKKKDQERNFVISTSNIFNFASKTLKRKIPMTKITGITISKNSQEFVLHVPDEYDYRYSCFPKQEIKFQMTICNSDYSKEHVLQYLIKAYCLAKKVKLPVMFVEESNLDCYATTRNDKKKNQSKMPNISQAILIDDTYFMNLNKRSAQNAQFYSCKINFSFYNQLDDKSPKTFQDFNTVNENNIELIQDKLSQKIYSFKKIDKNQLTEITQYTFEQLFSSYQNMKFVLPLHYCFLNENEVYFVMKTIEPCNLYERLRRKIRFSEKQSKFYVSQIVLALKQLHTSNQIYKDLKPESIYIQPSGFIELNNFQLARFSSYSEDNFTLEYIAPEVISNQQFSYWTDIWSLGILIYEIIIGVPPFFHQNKEIMKQQIISDNITFPQSLIISQQAKDLIISLLRKNPEQRLGFGNIEEILKHPWFSEINIDMISKLQVHTTYAECLDEKC